MSIFEYLPENDRAAIEAWIDHAAYHMHPDSKRSDLSVILREWSEKKEGLFKLFGNEMILMRDFSYDKPYSELEDEMHDFLDHDGHMFRSAIRDMRIGDDPEILRWSAHSYRRIYTRLLSANTLALNKYEGDGFDFPLPDGKVLRIENGCKPVKMLGKIAKAYNLPGFEEFRLGHSRVLNQKKLSGQMCLSIHPLDFMTMSDNESNWCSCMSWEDDGCYRSGTIECMNSPLVVVGYLKNECDMNLTSKYTWNNKKWRSLYIVYPNKVITSVKGYPYQNDEFNTFMLNWLQSLDNEHTYSEPKKYHMCGRGISFDLEKSTADYGITFEPYGHMYNDFGSCFHWGVFNFDNISSPDDCEVINYSGNFSCIHCGSLNAYNDDESELCGSCCVNSCRCCECDEMIRDDECYELDGEYYCSYCYNDVATRCAISDEIHHQNYMETLFIVPDGKTPAFDFPTVNIYEEYINNLSDWSRFFNHEKVREYVDSMCPWRSNRYYLYISDLTDRGVLKLLDGITREEYLSEYCD